MLELGKGTLALVPVFAQNLLDLLAFVVEGALFLLDVQLVSEQVLGDTVLEGYHVLFLLPGVSLVLWEGARVLEVVHALID